MPRMKNQFRIKGDSKPILEKVSVKLLMTPAEKVMFEIYSEQTGVDKTQIATKALNTFIRGDSYFKKIIEKNLILKARIEKATPSTKVKKVNKPKAKKVNKPKAPTVIRQSGANQGLNIISPK